MRSIIALAALAMMLGVPEAQSQTAADSAAVRATALDYIEGWYESQVEGAR
jgi:hypothetical protein